jgi:CRISPR-associated protein Cas5h
MKKVICFELRGDYAHFKKYYTTTSPLSFEFPPPPTVIGIISAILGFDKNGNFYLTKYPIGSYRLSIKINNPVNKVRWTLNFIDTKHHFWKIKNRTQIRTEFLKNPSYTIYFWHNDKEIYQSLKFHLQNHTSFYSISLGLSELLGNFKYLGEKNVKEKKESNFIQVTSVVPSSYVSKDGIKFSAGKEIFQANYPVYMNRERVVEKREKVFFDRKAQSIECKPIRYWQVENEENIVFF